VKSKAPFSPRKSVEDNILIALYGKLPLDPLEHRVYGYVASWPSEKALLAELQEVTKQRRGFRNAGATPLISAILSILLPAMCKRDATAFKKFARAIEAIGCAGFPAYPTHYHALRAAQECGGARAKVLPISFTEFQRLAEKRMGRSLDPGRFHHDCEQLGLHFFKDPKRGGRPKTKG